MTFQIVSNETSFKFTLKRIQAIPGLPGGLINDQEKDAFFCADVSANSKKK
jgi:hypothetical protein